MPEWNAEGPWYHGAQQELTRLRAGSSLSQNPNVARAFSHRPSLVVTEGDVIRHLRAQGCELLREGSRHSVWWNPANRRTSTVPRHPEVVDRLAAKNLPRPRRARAALSVREENRPTAPPAPRARRC